MTPRRVSIVQSLRGGQHGYLVRWRDAGVIETYWTPALEEAVAVKHGLLAGQSLDEALRLTLSTG